MTKPTKWYVCPAKTQISLGIRPVWSESLLSAWRNLGSLATHWAHSENSGQTGQMPKLVWVYAGHTGHSVGFVMRWLNYWVSFFLILQCYLLEPEWVCMNHKMPIISTPMMNAAKAIPTTVPESNPSITICFSSDLLVPWVLLVSVSPLFEVISTSSSSLPMAVSYMAVTMFIMIKRHPKNVISLILMDIQCWKRPQILFHHFLHMNDSSIISSSFEKFTHTEFKKESS